MRSPVYRAVAIISRSRGGHADQLTARETEIATLVLRGRSTSEIAAELFIAPYTVHDHLKSIFEKVGVRSRRQLATEVFEPHYRAA